MTELTEELARKIDRASQILAGLSRAASRDCSWVRSSSDLHLEILELQSELRETAARVTGDNDLGVHFMQAQAVGTQISGLFQANEKLERVQAALKA
ncbi:hypothetical protein ACVWY0_004099 [Arthrobacter sp. UYNi723]